MSEKTHKEMEHYCLLAVEQDFAIRDPYITVRQQLIDRGLIAEYVVHRLTPEGQRVLDGCKAPLTEPSQTIKH